MTQPVDRAVLVVIADIDRQIADCVRLRRFLVDFYGVTSADLNTPGGESGTAREAPGDKRTEQSEMRGLKEGPQAAPRTHSEEADTSGTMSDVSAAMNTLLGDADVANETTADQGGGEGDDGHTVETDREAGASPASHGAAGKPVGSEGSAAPSLLSRVRTYMEAHPDSTARECADALGVDPVKVRNTARGVVVFAPALSPNHRRAASQAENVSARARAIAFVPPPGEMIERTAKRIDVAELHDHEPWLTPDEAATRLAIPVVNLRIFTVELEIEWSQPRAADQSAVQPPRAEPRTLRDRVVAMHRMHPAWGAGMISKELGCAYGSASTYLAEARRATREVA